MGEVAEQVGRFVTAYSSDLRDESLDGQRVVVGGIVTGVRTVITKAKATMAIVTLEDLQGTIEVVVFPRLYEQTDGDLARRRDPARRRPGRPQGRGGLAAGRPRRRLGRGGGRRRGGLRPAGRRRRAAWREAGADRRRTATATATERATAARPTGGPSSRSGRGRRRAVSVGAGGAGGKRPARRVPFVSPRRGGGSVERCPHVRAGAARDRAGRAVSTYPETPGVAIGPDQDDEPPVPDEARARIVADATADDAIDAGPETVLHVRFAGNAAPDRVVGAMETFKAVLRDRPGATRVVIHVPATGGGRRCRWSCAEASPTTPSSSPRSGGSSATAWSTFACVLTRRRRARRRR